MESSLSKINRQFRRRADAIGGAKCRRRVLGSLQEISACAGTQIFTLTRSVETTLIYIGFWTGNAIPVFSQGSYMGAYAALGTNFSFLISPNECFN